MRRTILLAAVAAIAACGLGATPASAAATGRATPVVFGSLGTRCTTVMSDFPLRIGAVCVTVIKQGSLWRADVRFLSDSGSLRQVSVKNLRLLWAGDVKEKTGRVLKLATGKRGQIPSNWWEPDISGKFVRAGVYNACIEWARGGRACTGTYWFYSLRVRL